MIFNPLILKEQIEDSFVKDMNISYTGNYTDEIKEMDGVLYRLLTLIGSGTLTLEKPLKGDIWIISGGGEPTYPPEDYSAVIGGNGGGGGGFSAYKENVNMQTIQAQIGADLSITSISGDISFSTERAGDFGPRGGSGGGTGTGHEGDYNLDYVDFLNGDGKSKHPFESEDMPLVGGAGGEGGHVIRTWNVSMYESTYYNGGDGGSDGNPGGKCYQVNYYPCKGGAGGAGGGGEGGDCNGIAETLCTFGKDGSMYGAGGGQNGWYAENDSRWPEYYDYYTIGTYGTIASGYQGVAYVRFPLKQK